MSVYNASDTSVIDKKISHHTFLLFSRMLQLPFFQLCILFAYLVGK